MMLLEQKIPSGKIGIGMLPSCSLSIGTIHTIHDGPYLDTTPMVGVTQGVTDTIHIVNYLAALNWNWQCSHWVVYCS